MPDSTPTIDLAENLLKCLTNLEPAESKKAFAISDVQLSPPNSGICLNDPLKHIEPPLSERDATAFREAEFDKDSAPRGIHELPAPLFQDQEPA